MSNSRYMAAAAAAALSVVIASAVLVGCGGQDKSMAAASTARQATPVQVTPATTGDVPAYIDQIGNATGLEVVAIRPQVAGRLTELHFKDGDEIKKGQVLAIIDPRPYQATLDQAKASLERAKAVLELAQQDLARAEDAIKGNAISREQFETRKNAVAVAQANIAVQQADVQQAQINVDYCTITSPIDGRAGRRLVDVGNVVKANDDNPLLVIQRMDPVYADFTIPEQRLSEVRRDLAAGTLKALVRLPEDPAEKAREGQLTFLDNSVQDGTGTIKLRATVPNEDRHFWPGQFVQVRLVLKMQKDAVLVPARAQQVGQQGPFVYVVKEGAGPDGKPATVAELRPIVLGQRQGDMVVVEKGLKPGEKVVVVGQMMIMPGGPVQVVPTPGGAAPAGAPGGASASAASQQ